MIVERRNWSNKANTKYDDAMEIPGDMVLNTENGSNDGETTEEIERIEEQIHGQDIIWLIDEEISSRTIIASGTRLKSTRKLSKDYLDSSRSNTVLTSLFLGT